jgi:hypothetical protein
MILKKIWTYEYAHRSAWHQRLQMMPLMTKEKIVEAHFCLSRLDGRVLWERRNYAERVNLKALAVYRDYLVVAEHDEVLGLFGLWRFDLRDGEPVLPDYPDTFLGQIQRQWYRRFWRHGGGPYRFTPIWEEQANDGLIRTKTGVLIDIATWQPVTSPRTTMAENLPILATDASAQSEVTRRLAGMRNDSNDAEAPSLLCFPYLYRLARTGVKAAANTFPFTEQSAYTLEAVDVGTEAIVATVPAIESGFRATIIAADPEGVLFGAESLLSGKLAYHFVYYAIEPDQPRADGADS